MVLSTIAKAIARSTRVVGYRGAGRLFGPLSRIPIIRNAEATVPLGATRAITFPAYDPYWAQYLWTGKPYEPDVSAIFEDLAKVPNKVLVDCGANIGFWTVTLSDPRFAFNRIIAVEANPYVLKYLRRNVALNDIDVDVYHAAVARQDGLTMHIDASHGHAVGVVGDVGTPVQTVSLSSVLRNFADLESPPVAVVKLDVEGFEIEAIQGADKLDRLDVIYVYEDWPRSGMKVSEYLLGRGYSVIGVHVNGRRERLQTVAEAVDFNRRSTKAYGPSNLVGIRKPALYPDV